MSAPFERTQLTILSMDEATASAGSAPEPSYWLTRFAFLRLLGLVYAVAFAIVVSQWQPLLGSHGLLPAREVLDGVAASQGRGALTFLRLPTLFLFDDSDTAFRVGGWVGLATS